MSLLTSVSAQKYGTITITTYSFQSEGTDSAALNEGYFMQVQNDESDAVYFWNDFSQKLIRFHIDNDKIKFKIHTLPNGNKGPANTDFYIKITISKGNKVIRQETDNFSLYPSSRGDYNTTRHYYAILLTKQEIGNHDGSPLKIKADLYRKGEPMMLNTRTKVLVFEAGE